MCGLFAASAVDRRTPILALRSSPWFRLQVCAWLLLSALICPLLPTLPAQTAAAFTYTTNQSAITITGYLGDGGSVDIPAEINGLPVNRVGDFAFESSRLSAVTVPETVIVIGDFAFYDCRGLTNISLGAGITVIGSRAFSDCHNLESISIPGSVTTLGMSAFSWCSKLSRVTLTNGLISIGERAFRFCRNLSSIALPESVASVGYEAFAFCDNLTHISVPQGPSILGYGALRGVGRVDPATGYKTLTFNDAAMLLGAVHSGGTANIPSSIAGQVVKYIGDGVFANQEAITHITLPDTILSIGRGAFQSCHNLTSIAIPDGVETIGASAFDSCVKIGSLVLPNSVTSIGWGAFGNCGGLTNLVLGNRVARIEGQAFSGCVGLHSVVMPDSVTHIGYGAFESCTGIKEVTVPDGVVQLGDLAFAHCTGLKVLRLPPALESAAINCCPGDGVIDPLTGVRSIILNQARLITGRDADNEELVIPDAIGGLPVVGIGGHAFALNYGLRTVAFPDSITSIGGEAFHSCYALGSVAIPDSVTNIGRAAFAGCSGLKELSLGQGVVSLGDAAFSYCSSLGSLVIPNNVKTIAGGAFAQCISLTNVIVGNGVTSIGDGAFDTRQTHIDVIYGGGISVYFLGDAPVAAKPFRSEGEWRFDSSIEPVVSYVAGSTGWEKPFGGVTPTVWLPRLQSYHYSGERIEGTFTLSAQWIPGRPVIVEAAEGLENPQWSPIGTNVLKDGTAVFTDPAAAGHSGRFYRLLTP